MKVTIEYNNKTDKYTLPARRGEVKEFSEIESAIQYCEDHGWKFDLSTDLQEREANEINFGVFLPNSEVSKKYGAEY